MRDAAAFAVARVHRGDKNLIHFIFQVLLRVVSGRLANVDSSPSRCACLVAELVKRGRGFIDQLADADVGNLRLASARAAAVVPGARVRQSEAERNNVDLVLELAVLRLAVTPSSSRNMSTAISSPSLSTKNDSDPSDTHTPTAWISPRGPGGWVTLRDISSCPPPVTRHQAHADIHPLELEMRAQIEIGGVVAGVLLVRRRP